MAAPRRTVLDDGTEIIRSCAWSPPGCHAVGCGLKLFVKDGKLVKVEGDPDHPVTQGRLCVRCLDLVEYVNHPDRVLYPMKRAKEDRGKDKWQRITWDEAYVIIKEETEKIWAKYGHESSVIFTGTGRLSPSMCHMISDVALGSPNFVYTQSGWSCYGPRSAVSNYIMGAWWTEADYACAFKERYDDPRYTVPEAMVIWGKEPLKSNPDGFFGHSVVDLMKRGTKVIHVDPSMTWLGSRSEYVLRLRPGTDTALAMAILYVIIEEDLYDHDFVDKWVYRWEDFKNRIMDGHTPEWAEEITWVPAEQIRGAARLIANSKPCNFTWGVALDQNPNGIQACQCYIAIAAITGNLDVPGGPCLGVKDWNIRSAVGFWKEYLDEDIYKKRVGLMDYPFTEMSTDTAHPDCMLDCLETDKPYPIRMAVISNSNPIAPTNSAQPERWYKALQKMEFVFATELFQTPMTMAFADVFLPLATLVETDQIVTPSYGLAPAFSGAINQAVPEYGECKSEFQICVELCKLLRPEAELPFKDLDEFLSQQLASYPEVDGFKDFRERVVYMPDEVKYKKYETGAGRPDGVPGFNTPTGKLELYSTVYEAFGEDPLPYFEEPRWSPVSKPELADEYPFILTTGARKYTSFHSEHRQLPTLRKIDKYADFKIHPDAAAKLGIKEGDWCYIENMFGKCKEVAHITEEVDPRIISASHGWWYPEEEADEPSLFGVWKSNINNLVPHHDIGRMGFGAPYKCLMCKVYKAEDEE